ncbi:MAG TPA: sugar ABC transporter permease [Cyanobacteria bacterium UBA8530]|nr:sugar ABC transporter permease [Cyanobacteria bacterium UBA8530]
MKIKAGNDSKLALLYIAPAALVMALITFYPLLYGVWMAFTNFSPRHIRNGGAAFVGFQNFFDIVRHAPYLDFSFLGVFGFNLVWTLVNLVFHVSLGVFLAVILNTPNLAGKKFYRAALILPWAVPTYVTALVWRNMFDTQFGAVNLLLKSIDTWLHTFLPGAWVLPIPDWLGTFPQAFYAVLLVNVWLGFPFMMMVASGALQAIPKDLYEAAEVDGGTRWYNFWKITVPLLKPAMIPAIMLGFIWTFNNFNVIYFVSKGDPLGKTEILVTQAYKLVDSGMYGTAAAFALLIFLFLLVFTFVNLRITKAAEEV